MSAELDAHEDVEHGVEAAMGEGEVAADEQGVVQPLDDPAALNDLQFLQRLQKQDQVVGSPADKVCQHDGEDEPDCSVVPFGPGAEQGPENLHVAEQDNAHGEQEEYNVLVGRGEEPLGFGIITYGRFCIIKHPVEHGVGDGGQDAGCPHSCGHQHTAPEGMDPQGREGAHHRLVAEHGHDRQEEDAAEKAGGEHHVGELAEEVSQHPAPVVPQGPQRQQAGEHEV